MAETNTGAGPGQDVRSRCGLLRFSLGANAALAIVALGLAAWGWKEHQHVIEADKKVAAADEKVTAANAERDEAYQTSRDLQYGLIKARGELKGVSDTLRPPSTGDDQETDTPR